MARCSAWCPRRNAFVSRMSHDKRVHAGVEEPMNALERRLAAAERTVFCSVRISTQALVSIRSRYHFGRMEDEVFG